MSEANKAIVKQMIDDLYNTKRLDTIDTIFSADYVLHANPYVGLGFEVDLAKTERATVILTSAGGPSDGKLLYGDEIVRVEDAVGVYEGTDYWKITERSRGAAGEWVRMRVKRNGELVDIELTRDVVDASAGWEIIEPLYESRFENMPDATFTVERMIAEDDIVAVQLRAAGTSKRYDRRLTWMEMHMLRLDSGKIVEQWELFDGISLMEQSGFQITAPTTK